MKRFKDLIMKTRALKFKLLCGLEGCVPLNPTDLSEASSAEEFITIIDKFRTGIRKFNDRNPNIVWLGSPTSRKDVTINTVIHEIINSRKCMNFPNVDPNDFWQVFELDFTKETITLYQADLIANPLHELGTMHINTMFTNWKDCFYSHLDSWVDDMEYEEEVEMVMEEEPSLFDKISPLMEERLDDAEYNLWKRIYDDSEIESNFLKENMYLRIAYSGSGDSGDIDDITIHEKTGTSSHSIGNLDYIFSIDAVREIHDLIWKAIDHKEGGFYNNDGGRGDMEIHLAKFNWDHWNYYIEESHSTGIDADFSHVIPKVEEDVFADISKDEDPVTKLIDSMIDPATYDEYVKSLDLISGTPITTLKEIVKKHHPDLFDANTTDSIEDLTDSKIED